MEKLARESGKEFKNLPRNEMESLWEAAKKSEKETDGAKLHGARAKR
jgi:hypothetical protein